MAIGGVALRSLGTFLYAVEFGCAVIILGIYGYFMATMGTHDINIPGWVKAVTGLAAVATLYLTFAVLLTCFLGGVSLFTFTAIFLNLLFIGVFIAIAVMTRDGANSCQGFVHTPLGNGFADSDAPGISNYRYACRLNKVAFAVSLIALILLLFSVIVQYLINKNHKRTKTRDAELATSRRGHVARTPFWKRGRKTTHHHGTVTTPPHSAPMVGTTNGHGIVGEKHHAGYHTTPVTNV